MTAKITIKPGKDNSRNRRRERRKQERDEADKQASAERLESLESLGGLHGVLAEKALRQPTEAVKDKQQAEEGGCDAMTMRVNHAHQRDKRKKWS
ncbi:hypothetical protein ACI49Z_003443 [Cronobacter turicensis]